MPEEAVATSPLAKEIEAKTMAAAKEQGLVLDKALDAEFDAALAKDQGHAPPAPRQEPAAPAAAKPAMPAPTKDELSDGLPPELFKPKEAASPPAKTDAERSAEHEAMVKEQTKGMSAKAADKWREVHKRALEAEQKAARAEALEKELATLKSAAPPAEIEEVKKLRKQNEELDALVKKQRLADHPAFKAHYDGKIEKKIAAAKAVVGKEKEAEVEGLLRLPDSSHRRDRLNDLMADLRPVEAAEFGNAIAAVNDLARERQEKLNDASAELAQEQQHLAQQAQMSETKHAEALTNAWNETEKRLKDPESGPELFREVPGNDEWNKSVRERIEKAKEIFSKGPSMEAVAELTAMAVAMPNYRDLFLMQRSMTAKLKAKLAELSGSEPSVRPGAEVRAVDFDSNESFIDAVVKGAMKEGFLKQ